MRLTRRVGVMKNIPKNSYLSASFKRTRVRNADSTVTFIATPSIIYGQVNIFEDFKLNSLLANCFGFHVALCCRFATIASIRAGSILGCYLVQ